MFSFSLRRKSTPERATILESGSPPRRSSSRTRSKRSRSLSSKGSLSSLFSKKDNGSKPVDPAEEDATTDDFVNPASVPLNPGHNSPAGEASSSGESLQRSISDKFPPPPTNWLESLAQKLKAAAEIFHQNPSIEATSTATRERAQSQTVRRRLSSPKKSVRFRSQTFSHDSAASSSPITVPAKQPPQLLSIPTCDPLKEFGGHTAQDAIPTGRPEATPYLKSLAAEDYFFPFPTEIDHNLEQLKAEQRNAKSSPESEGLQPANQEQLENPFDDAAAAPPPPLSDLVNETLTQKELKDLDDRHEPEISSDVTVFSVMGTVLDRPTLPVTPTTWNPLELPRVRETSSNISVFSESSQKTVSRHAPQGPGVRNAPTATPMLDHKDISSPFNTPEKDIDASESRVANPCTSAETLVSNYGTANLFSESLQAIQPCNEEHPAEGESPTLSPWDLRSRPERPYCIDLGTDSESNASDQSVLKISPQRQQKDRTHEDIRRRFRMRKPGHQNLANAASPQASPEQSVPSPDPIKRAAVAAPDCSDGIPQPTSPTDLATGAGPSSLSRRRQQSSLRARSPERSFRFSNASPGRGSITEVPSTTFGWEGHKIAAAHSPCLSSDQTPSPVSVPLPLSVPPKRTTRCDTLSDDESDSQSRWTPFDEPKFAERLIDAFQHDKYLVLLERGGYAKFWLFAGLPESTQPPTDKLKVESVQELERLVTRCFTVLDSTPTKKFYKTHVSGKLPIRNKYPTATATSPASSPKIQKSLNVSDSDPNSMTDGLVSPSESTLSSHSSSVVRPLYKC